VELYLYSPNSAEIERMNAALPSLLFLWIFENNEMIAEN
jgi:hypothetical protein